MLSLLFLMHSLVGGNGGTVAHASGLLRTMTGIMEASAAVPGHDSARQSSTQPGHDSAIHDSTQPGHDSAIHGSTQPGHDSAIHDSTQPGHDSAIHGSTQPGHDSAIHDSTQPGHDSAIHGSTQPGYDSAIHGSTQPGHDSARHSSTQEQHSSSEAHHPSPDPDPHTTADPSSPDPHTCDDLPSADPSVSCPDLSSRGGHSDDLSSPDLGTALFEPHTLGDEQFLPHTSCDDLPSASRHAPCDGQQSCPESTSPQTYRGEPVIPPSAYQCQDDVPLMSPPRHSLLRPPEPLPCVSTGYSPPPGRFARLGKVTSPGNYQSNTLGRPSRRARHVAPPKVPAADEGRGSRCQTEPPPNMAPPELLQVSWVWESRPPARGASIRRRPSCIVSCRRKCRPSLAPRRGGPRCSTSSSHRSRSSVDEDAAVEQDKGFCSGGELTDESGSADESKNEIDVGVEKRDVVLLDTGGSGGRSANTVTPEEAGDGPPVTPDTQQVRLRNKRNSYIQAASQSLKEKWRNSELLFPKILNDTLDVLKSSEPNKRKTIFERARNLPFQMRNFSYLFTNVREVKNVDMIVKRRGTSTFYLELKDLPAEGVDQRRRSVRPRSGQASTHPSVRLRKRSSFSPRNSLNRTKNLNWNEKYQNVMGNKSESMAACGPAIHVTTVEDQEAPLSQDDGPCPAVVQDDRPCPAVVQDDGPCPAVVQDDRPCPAVVQGSEQGGGVDQGRPQREQDKKQGGGVLERLLGRLRRPRSLSTTRSWASSRSSVSGGSEDGQSPSHSSDYEEHEEVERTGSASLVGRMRGLRRDMQKKISRLKSPRGSTSSSPGPVSGTDKAGASLTAPAHQPHTASSYESIPSSAPLATTASGSNRSSLSGEEAEPYTGPFIGRARALVDCQPSPYDRDALKFKKGDIIDIIAKNPSGLWKGSTDGRVGHFKFILVEEEVERPARRSRAWRGTTPRRGRARTLEELLTRLHLSHLIQVFVLNGYEDLEQFRDVEKTDLDCLGITDPETCAKLLTAVALLHDADSEPEPDLPETLDTTEAALQRGDHGRDSGCYTDHRSTHAVVLDENNLDTRQSTPSTDNSSGYHSRGAYNIPLGEATQTSRDDPQSSALESPPSESTTTGAAASVPPTHSESHSYRAHLATVLPASPRSQSRHSHQGEQKQRHDPQVDYEAKFVTARSVFEKDVVRREVPITVRVQKRSMGSSHSLTGDTEDGVKYDGSVAAAELPSP